MSFCLFGHPDQNGGPGVELPLLIFDDGTTQVFMNPTAVLNALRNDRGLVFKGITVKAPPVFADATAVINKAATLQMAVQAIESTVTLDGTGVVIAIAPVQNGQVLNPPRNTTPPVVS